MCHHPPQITRSRSENDVGQQSHVHAVHRYRVRVDELQWANAAGRLEWMLCITK